MNIGEQLKEARSDKKLSISDIASTLRINKKYIQALEDNNFLLLPSQIYAKGFLKAYAEYLELDPKPLLIELAGYYKGVEESKKAVKPVMKNKKNINTQYLIYAGYIMIAFIAAALVFFSIRSLRANNSASKPINITTLASAAKLETKKVEAKKVDIKIEAAQRSWIYVIVDNKETYSETLEPGDSLSFSGKVVSVKVGNAAGVKISRDGQSFGNMGDTATVMEQTYRAMQ